MRISAAAWLRRTLALGSVFGACSGSARAAEPKLAELVARADHVLRGKTTAALLEMHVVTASYDRRYEIVLWTDDRGGRARALVKILGPARWRGHGTLKLDGRLSLYDPATDRVTVLSSSMLGDNWMGSHFTNDDLVKETDLAKDYRASLIASGPLTVGGKPATDYRIRLDPTPEAPVAWDHLVLELYEQGALVVPLREDYYRRAQQAAPTRTLTFGDVRDLGGRTVPARLTMRVADKPGEYTELVYEQARFDTDVPQSKFTEQALRQ